MGRSNAAAKAAGSRLEREVADYLAAWVDDRIDRRVKTGAKDKGDIGGVRFARPALIGTTSDHSSHGRVVAECKDYGGRVEVGPWLGEAEVERLNDEAEVGLVIAKRRGKADAGDQLVLMTVRDLATLLSGRRPTA